MAKPRKPVPKRAPQPPSVFRPLTPKQLQKQANDRVNAALAALRAPIETARQAAAQKAAADRASIAASGAAAAQILGEYAPAVSGMYGTAAKDLGSLAGGFSSGTAERVAQDQNANADFIKSQVGGAPTGAVDTNALKDTIYGVGGYIPGSSLVEQGAAAGKQAALLPTISALTTQQEQQASDVTAGQTDKDYEQQLIDLAKQRPDLMNKVMDELTNLEMQKLNARLSVQDASIKQQAQDLYAEQFGHKVAQDSISNSLARKRIYVDQQSLNLRQEKQKADVQKALNSGREVNASASRALGYLVDKYGNPIKDARGNKIRVSKTASGTATNPMQKATQDARELRGDPVVSTVVDKDVGDPLPGKYLAKPGAKGVYHRPGYPDRTDDPKKARTDSTMTFASAQSYLVSTYGLTRAQARRALISAGWKPDGKRPTK